MDTCYLKGTSRSVRFGSISHRRQGLGDRDHSLNGNNLEALPGTWMEWSHLRRTRNVGDLHCEQRVKPVLCVLPPIAGFGCDGHRQRLWLESDEDR